MLVMDALPEVPRQYAPVLVAQATPIVDQTESQRSIGVCHYIDARPEAINLAVNALTPLGDANNYFLTVEKKYLGPDPQGQTTLLAGPVHGVLESDAEGNYLFVVKPGYYGPDQATFLVEIGGYKVKVVYHFKIVPGVSGGAYWDNPEYCPQGPVWKISLNPEDPNALIYTFQHPNDPTNPLPATQPNLAVAPLTGGALAQTDGTTITLDPTPGDNSEFLPTSNPNEWIAKKGSAAYSKMDHPLLDAGNPRY